MKQLFQSFLLMALLMSISLKSSAQVTVTYKVDISNYLAGGASLGVNGIRIGGNFAALNSPLPDWQPSAVQCGMSNTGSNIWSISVTYPATSIGQTQLYKFVNNDWGTNEGTTGSTIASGGCGQDDGGGNINRSLVIPSSNTTVCFVWDACTSCQTGSAPSASTVSPATAITANSATVAGSATGSGITARGICYATTQNPTISNSLASAGNGAGNFNANLSGLAAASTYYARAFATNASGTAYGNEISFTTLPALDITATTGTSSNITSNTANVSGTASGSGIAERGICYSLSQNPTLDDSVAASGSGEGSFTSSLSGLLPNSTYYARAFGSGPAGTSYGTQISFSTLPAQPQGISITYQVDITNYLTAGNSLGANGIRIAGNFADLGATVNGNAMVNWTPSNAFSAMSDEGNNLWSITINYPSSAAGQAQLYKFVNNDWGTNEGSDPANTLVSGGCGIDDGAGNVNRRLVLSSQNQTLSYCWDRCNPCGGAPTAPVVTTATAASALTNNSATVAGNATGTGITARGVCFATTQNPSILNSVANAGTGEGNFTANLSGLSPATLYYARAFATNAVGTSYGPQISFTTLTSQVQTVNVTYSVDVSNYIAAGNTIGAGGIRIAGNFANRGAKVNGTAMANWTPTNPASAMTNAGNNIWSIIVTYPDSSFGKTQSYKFVNNDWGTNEGGANSNILNGACGQDDGSGNINRTLLIPNSAQSVAYCWDQCTPCTNTNLLTVTTAASATAITSNSASVSGSASGTGITARGVCYASSPNPSISNSVANAGTGEGNFTANLSGLSPSTLYYAKAFAISPNDTAYGAEISFTTSGGSSGNSVNVSYRVDVSNYIAAGNTIGAGGIRIAGNFADRGAKVNGTAMVNWTPTNPASAMTNAGNNIWTITVTYPDSAFGKAQIYKFVNNDWGTNEGTDPTNTLVSGGCGTADPGGNVNRFLTITPLAQNLNFCWDQCTPCTNTNLLTVNTAVSATAITSNSASVAGSASGTGITARGVCYASSPNPSISNSVANAGTGEGNFTANLSGLSPSTLYYAKAFAISLTDTAYGAEISFTTSGGSSGNSVNVSYRVDVSNYIAAGNIIGAGGIRIAGNFADRGAKVNGTSMVNWTPTNPTSAMTNAGNNIWTITVTYPDTSFGKTQIYKFVNNDWGTGTYEGTNPTNTLVSGGCGIAEPGGIIHRILTITAVAQNLNFCWDQCTPCTNTNLLTVTTAASATAITSNSASVAGSASGTGITARGVCYASSPNPSISNSVANAGTGEGNFTANLSGLSPSTLYYARAFAISLTDTAYGAEIPFTTLTQAQTVDVTYSVDVSNYIAAGNIIGAGGIRIGGNFADRGARVNGTAMVNWTPTNPASAMTNAGNNLWTITVTYPDSAFGKAQTYKFVNNDWGTNEGTDPTNTLVSGGCGIADPGGNINRFLTITPVAQNLSFCWDQCNTSCTTGNSERIISAIDIYPNPFQEAITIESMGKSDFRIVSVLGWTFMEGQLKAGKNLLETNSLPKGFYFLQLENGSVRKLEKR